MSTSWTQLTFEFDQPESPKEEYAIPYQTVLQCDICQYVPTKPGVVLQSDDGVFRCSHCRDRYLKVEAKHGKSY